MVKHTQIIIINTIQAPAETLFNYARFKNIVSWYFDFRSWIVKMQASKQPLFTVKIISLELWQVPDQCNGSRLLTL